MKLPVFCYSSGSRRRRDMDKNLYNILGNTDEMTREAWLETRKLGIGGSDVAGITGLSKWASPLSVYMDKTGQAPDKEENEAMYWGNVLETVVASEFMRRTGKKVQTYPYLMQSKQYPFMLANVDRLLVDEAAGLECKTAGVSTGKEWDDDSIPEAYMLQCYHYMIVTGLKKWYVAVLIGGNNFQIRELVWDQEIADKVIQIESDFWKMVEERTPPAAGGCDIDLLTCLYQGVDNAPVQLGAECETYAMQYLAAAQAEKAAKAAKDEAKALLCSNMGEHTTAQINGMKLTWTPYTMTTIDTERLKKEMPNIAALYSKTSNSRRFSVK